jgi:hypothetical protein
MAGMAAGSRPARGAGRSWHGSSSMQQPAAGAGRGALLPPKPRRSGPTRSRSGPTATATATAPDMGCPHSTPEEGGGGGGGAGRGGGKRGAAPPALLKREAYDADMRRHLLAHSTPHKVELTVQAATVFVARARLAHKVVEKRKVDAGCSSAAPWVPGASPSKKEAQAEKLRAQMTREEKIEDGLALLRQRVDNIQVKVVHMEDDGNCQFRSLAQELYGDQGMHAGVRQAVVAHMRAHADSYSFFIGEEGEWRQYLARMERERVWGDELTLRAAADCFGVVVHVVTTEHENWLLNYVPEGMTMEGGGDGTPPVGTRECFLAYVSPIHYNVVVSLDSPLQRSTSGY